MRKHTRKKALVLALVLVLLSIAIVGGSLAWFSADDEVTNTFTVGSIEVVQHEKQHNENKDLVDFVPNQTLLPILNVEDPTADPGYVEKIVTVENTGRNAAYIRTFIAIPTALNNYLYLDINMDADKWVRYSTTTDAAVGDIVYTIYRYDYTQALAPKETTPALLKGVYLLPHVDVQENPQGAFEFCHRGDDGEFHFSGFEATFRPNNIQVLVATQAVQTEGFTDPADAFQKAFGDAAPSFQERAE